MKPDAQTIPPDYAIMGSPLFRVGHVRVRWPGNGWHGEIIASAPGGLTAAEVAIKCRAHYQDNR